MKWFVLALLLVPMVQAYDEADAPTLDDRIVRVWHEPDVPAPGSQWQGFIELAPGHNVTEVRYQICRVGQNCFAPPTPAQDMGDNVYRFDTDDYRDPVSERPIDWGADLNGDGQPWLIGVQYFLLDGSDDVGLPVPEGIEIPSEECDAVGWIECSASHYFVFAMPAAQASNDIPNISIILLAAALLAVARFYGR